jgi:hypothetical protein
MEFLKDSWANLQDLEENAGIQPSLIQTQAIRQVVNPILTLSSDFEANSAEDLRPSNIDKDGFQQVLSKSAKKQHKTSAASSKYPIRSRVGSAKPCK